MSLTKERANESQSRGGGAPYSADLEVGLNLHETRRSLVNLLPGDRLAHSAHPRGCGPHRLHAHVTTANHGQPLRFSIYLHQL
jgi:hypothetical protein